MKFHSFLENIHFMIFEFHSIQKNIHFLTRALYSIQNFIQFKENPCHSFKKTIHLFEKSFIEHPYTGVGEHSNLPKHELANFNFNQLQIASDAQLVTLAKLTPFDQCCVQF